MKLESVGIIIMLIIAALVVLFIMNPNGFSTVVRSLGNQTVGESAILTGSGYKKAT